MKGCAIITPQLAIVVAEGPAKAQKKYSKLMLQRIAWNAGRDEEEGAPERYGQPQHLLPPQSCTNHENRTCCWHACAASVWPVASHDRTMCPEVSHAEGRPYQSGAEVPVHAGHQTSAGKPGREWWQSLHFQTGFW